MDPGQNHEAQAAVISSLLINAVLAAAKIAGGWAGHSYALTADGIESFNDVFASAIALISLRVAARPADARHPYGYGRAEQVGTLFSALSLLAAAALIAYQSFHDLVQRQTAPAWFTLPVLLVVIVVKAATSRYVAKKSTETRSAVLEGEAYHHRTDMLTSAVTFAGITVALLGGKRLAKADDIAALFACAVVAYNGIKLLKTALYENLDGAPSSSLRRQTRRIASSVRGVKAIEKLRMKKSGLGYHMDIHVQVDPALTVEEGHDIGHDVQHALLDSGQSIEDVVVHVEPYRR